jgi:hypothetical protein
MPKSVRESEVRNILGGIYFDSDNGVDPQDSIDQALKALREIVESKRIKIPKLGMSRLQNEASYEAESYNQALDDILKDFK